MIRRAIRFAIQASHPPSPQRRIDAARLPHQTAAASVSIGTSAESTLGLLMLELGPQTLLIPDFRASGAPGPKLTHSVASRIAQVSEVTLGLPNSLNATDSRRWRLLASSVGAGVTVLGSTGWDRVNFGEQSLILESGDYPAEVRDTTSVVALSRPSDSGCIGLWEEAVHPNTALRARVSGNARVELSMGVHTEYLVAGQIGSMWLIAVAAPAIVAELVARGLQRMRDEQNGIESIGPWEDDGVQHLANLGEASSEVANLVLDARLEDNVTDDVARRLAETLGWRLRLRDDDPGGEKT